MTRAQGFWQRKDVFSKEIFADLKARLAKYAAHLDAEAKKLIHQLQPLQDSLRILSDKIFQESGNDEAAADAKIDSTKEAKIAREIEVNLAIVNQKRAVVHAVLMDMNATVELAHSVMKPARPDDAPKSNLPAQLEVGYLHDLMLAPSAIVRARDHFVRRLTRDAINVYGKEPPDRDYSHPAVEKMYEFWKANPSIHDDLKKLINLHTKNILLQRLLEKNDAAYFEARAAIGLIGKMVPQTKRAEEDYKNYERICADQAWLRSVWRGLSDQEDALRKSIRQKGEPIYGGELSLDKIELMLSLENFRSTVIEDIAAPDYTFAKLLAAMEATTLQVTTKLPNDDRGLLRLLAERRGHNPFVWFINKVREMFGYAPLTMGVTGYKEVVEPILTCCLKIKCYRSTDSLPHNSCYRK